MCLLSFLKWGSIGYSLGIVWWDFTSRNHPGNPRRVSRSGLVRSDNKKMRPRRGNGSILNHCHTVACGGAL